MRLRFKIPLVGAIAVAALVITALVLLYRSHILENWVNRYLADKIADRYNLDVNIAEIEGSLFNGFKMTDILVRYYDHSDTVNLAYVPRLSIRYSVSDLWHRRWIIDSLEIAGAQLFLLQDSTGRWMLPEGPSGDTSEPSPPPSWMIKAIEVKDASLNVGWAGEKYQWTDIDLLASVKSEEGTYTFRLDSLNFDAGDDRLNVKYARGLATLFRDNLAMDSVAVETDSSYLSFSLVHETEDGETWYEGRVDSAHLYLPDIVSFLGPDLEGTVDINGDVYRKYGKTGGNLLITGMFEKRRFDSLHTGFHFDDGVLFLDTLYGRILDGCGIRGYGEINFKAKPAAYRLKAHLDEFDLNNLVFDSYYSRLNGRVEANGRGFKSENMAIDLNLKLDESHLDIFHFHKASGQMSIGKKGLYIFPGFRVVYHDNRFLCDGGVSFDGNVTVSCRADLNRLADFEHQTFIDLPAGRASAEFSITGPTSDPDLRAHVMSDSIWLYDFFSSDLVSSFYIRSFIRSMRGPIIFQCRRGEAWGIEYDSLYAEMTLDSNLLYIDTGSIANDFAHTELAGQLDFESYPQRLTLDTVVFDLSERQFLSNGKQSILIDSSGYQFERINIYATDGNLWFNGRADYDDSLSIIWEINNIDIAPWVRLYSDTLDLRGRLSSVGSLYNTIDQPEFSLQASLDSLHYQNLLLGDLRAFLSYEDSTLWIDSSYLESPQGMYSASGEFPINLIPGPDHELFDDRRQDITITAVDKQLDLVAYLLQSVEDISGNFSAEIYVGGRPLEPRLDGVCRLKEGSVKLYDLQDRLENVNVELSMSDRLITIEKASAIAPDEDRDKPGRVSGRGTILVRDIESYLYAVTVEAERMPIDYELGDVTGTANADLFISGETPPKVTGTIEMPSLTYRESFETTGFSMLSTLEADKSWDLDLMVEFPSKFWVKNDDIDAEFAGDLNIIRDNGIYNFLGTLEVIRGKYFFFDKTFKMTPGGEIIYENIEEPDPRLNLEIATRIRTPSTFTEFESEDNYSYELRLAVTGTLNNPIITGAGEQPISSENILPALLADYRPGIDSIGGDRVLTSRITVGGVGLLATQFSRLGTRTLGVETFEIYPDMGPTFDPLSTRVTIGAYTFPNLYVFGSSYFDIQRGQEVGMEYRLGRHYLFEGRRDESNLYHLNFKFFWEY